MEQFEKDLIEVFGDRIREDDEFAKRIYAALANVKWNKGDIVYGCTFRYAGGLISDIREEGDYIDWYCCAPEGKVDSDIREALSKKGWTPSFY